MLVECPFCDSEDTVCIDVVHYVFRCYECGEVFDEDDDCGAEDEPPAARRSTNYHLD